MTLVEINRDQVESIVIAELDFLLDYERQLTDPDTELVDALRLVRKQFETIKQPVVYEE